MVINWNTDVLADGLLTVSDPAWRTMLNTRFLSQLSCLQLAIQSDIEDSWDTSTIHQSHVSGHVTQNYSSVPTVTFPACVVHVCRAPCRAFTMNLDLGLEDIQLWRMNVYIVASASEESSCDLTAMQIAEWKNRKMCDQKFCRTSWNSGHERV